MRLNICALAARTPGEGIRVAQADAASPTILVCGRPPGDSGIAVVHSHFVGGAHASGAPADHIVAFHLGPPTPVHCRMADRRLDHLAPPGSLAIIPAQMDIGFDAEGGHESLAVQVSPERLKLAAAQRTRMGATLAERLSGGDLELERVARALAAEAASGFGNGPLYWDNLADELVDTLVDRHLTHPARPTQGTLSAVTLARLTEFIHAHLDEPMGVDALAAVAAQSRFHFSRVFVRSVGISPHRYVVRLRLERALALLKAGLPLSETAQRTGFADQSHLTRWVRRIYGAPPGKLGEWANRSGI